MASLPPCWAQSSSVSSHGSSVASHNCGLENGSQASCGVVGLLIRDQIVGVARRSENLLQPAHGVDVRLWRLFNRHFDQPTDTIQLRFPIDEMVKALGDIQMLDDVRKGLI